MTFTKMHGAGNDYIYFNCFNKNIIIENPEELAIKLSDRHFSIGGDGIVLICPSEVADAKMRMFNADGSEGKMCGNAIRCVGKYLYENGIVKNDEISIETLSGIKKLKMVINEGKAVAARVDMGKAILNPKDIPVLLEGDSIINRSVAIGRKKHRITCVSMGNPHCVVFVDDVDSLNLPLMGELFENNLLFPERINTEFVQVIDRTHLKMRVWERGSGETLACGTGACATVIAATLCGHCDKDVATEVILRGGKLIIEYTDETVFMTGEAKKVFVGEIDI
ncbi:MAG TPA: diaminopimelate epimerase [Clostridiales bacterium]|nr:MAG: diaminopimelate epimerase [Candidatus Margulisbacteria bacterium GWF2_35_9]HAN20714.1 diaminopimelate epimerase [Clostridiales bacterium]